MDRVYTQTKSDFFQSYEAWCLLVSIERLLQPTMSWNIPTYITNFGCGSNYKKQKKI